MSQREAEDSAQVAFNGIIKLPTAGSYIEFSDNTKQYSAYVGGGGGGTNQFPGGIIIGPADDFYAIGYQPNPQTCVITSDSVDVHRLASDFLAANETATIKVENSIDMQDSVLIVNTLASSSQPEITVNTSMQINADLNVDQNTTVSKLDAANIISGRIQCTDLIVSGSYTGPTTQPSIGANNIVLRSAAQSVNAWTFNLSDLNNVLINGTAATSISTPTCYNYTFAVELELDFNEVNGCYSTRIIFDQDASDEEFDTTSVQWGQDGNISAGNIRMFDEVLYSCGFASAGTATFNSTEQGVTLEQTNFLYYSFAPLKSGVDQPTIIQAVKGMQYDAAGNITRNPYQATIFTVLQDLSSPRYAYLYFSPTSYLLGL